MAEIKGGEKAIKEVSGIGKRLKGAKSVRIGFLEGETYPSGVSIPLVAAINEFGQTSIHPNQPPRPFMRNMVAEKSAEWPDAIDGLLKENNYDAKKVLGIVGAAIAGQLKESIQKFTDPPLAESTIKRKGFDKPLIDTGTMLAHVNFEVVEE